MTILLLTLDHSISRQLDSLSCHSFKCCFFCPVFLFLIAMDLFSILVPSSFLFFSSGVTYKELFFQMLRV
jgi:hypothetical protein